MKQEDYNDMMRYPWEKNSTRNNLLKCPCCNLKYMGNGKSLCLECSKKEETRTIFEDLICGETVDSFMMSFGLTKEEAEDAMNSCNTGED